MKQKFPENFKARPVKNEACTIFYKIVAVILVPMRAEANLFDYAECSRECALAKSRRVRFALNGQSYLCDRKTKMNDMSESFEM